MLEEEEEKGEQEDWKDWRARFLAGKGRARSAEAASEGERRRGPLQLHWLRWVR